LSNKNGDTLKSNDFENEAIRVVELLPDFKPGTLNGETVVVRRVIPIVFNFPLNNAKVDRKGIKIQRGSRVEIKADTIENKLNNYSIKSEISSPSISSLIDFSQLNDSLNRLTKNITIDCSDFEFINVYQTVLIVNNPTDYTLTYKVKIKRSSTSIYESTTVVPVLPHQISIETWPYKIEEFYLKDFRIKKN
jgi:hypothetical protein